MCFYGINKANFNASEGIVYYMISVVEIFADMSSYGFCCMCLYMELCAGL